MSLLLTREKKIKSKMKVLEKKQHFFHCKYMVNIPDAQGQLTSKYLSESWAKFKLILAFMIVLNTYKNEEDLIKNESARVVTTLNIDFQTLKRS